MPVSEQDHRVIAHMVARGLFFAARTTESQSSKLA
jgi:hypothetical protein